MRLLNFLKSIEEQDGGMVGATTTASIAQYPVRLGIGITRREATKNWRRWKKKRKKVEEQEASIGMPGGWGSAGGSPTTKQILQDPVKHDYGMTRREATKNWRRRKKRMKELFQNGTSHSISD
jgi:hypothetical protein